MDNCAEDNAECTNTIGSFTCACDPGYSGDGTVCMGECHKCAWSHWVGFHWNQLCMCSIETEKLQLTACMHIYLVGN